MAQRLRQDQRVERKITNARVLDLIIDLQSRSSGMSAKDVCAAYGVDRATAKRWFEAVEDFGYELKQVAPLESDHHRAKRYRIHEFVEDGEEGKLADLFRDKALALRFHASLDTKERMAVEGLLARLDGEEATAVKKLLVDDKGYEQWAVEIQKKIATTAHAARTGPSVSYDPDTLTEAEYCISNRQLMRFKYRAPDKQRASYRTIRPLGVVYHRFAYLVASQSHTGAIGLPLMFRLDLIKGAEAVEGDAFNMPSSWNFKDWVAKSYGVQRGKIYRFRLRFKKSIADRARAIKFHSSQRIISKSNRQGEYVIELECAGHQEVFAELASPEWIGRVKLEGEEALLAEYKRYIALMDRAI